jgi:RimJ/RimL family protein N-acetyltransferase
MQKILLKGRQVALRSLREEDLSCYIKWQISGHEWQKLDGPYYRSKDFDLQKQREEFQKHLSSPTAAPPKRLAITAIGKDGLMGTVNSYWESKETHWLCAGITIYDPMLWGKGIGFEALGLWTEYLFRCYEEIVRLDLRTWSGNNGMVRLAEKLGYQQEACFRKARIVDGKYFDGLGFGILREEWAERYPKGFSSHI